MLSGTVGVSPSSRDSVPMVCASCARRLSMLRRCSPSASYSLIAASSAPRYSSDPIHEYLYTMCKHGRKCFREAGVVCHPAGSALWGASCPRQGSPTPTHPVWQAPNATNLLPTRLKRTLGNVSRRSADGREGGRKEGFCDHPRQSQERSEALAEGAARER